MVQAQPLRTTAAHSVSTGARLIMILRCEDGIVSPCCCFPLLNFRPIYVSRADTLVDGTAEQTLLHNETGARLCHWYPAR
ncbi:hypothetical protein J2847_006696 [Azospirillum agricola]|uniref:hypothetical protein n=1 Tax=Azospirillum agricola TaxID=1720247 RepID=UPI001AE9554E|nr:hypothetical protein [Azospirillum agricola]MBP2233358.1 hypothetical protein [Azospirillum agricola]